MKLITSRYAGKCRSCQTPYLAGSKVGWQKGIRGALCEHCFDSQSPAIPNEPKPNYIPVAGEFGMIVPATKEPEFSIDWSELKEFVSTVLANNVAPNFRAASVRAINQFLLNMNSHWHGYTLAQLRDWLANGFQSAEIHGLEEFVPPIREKRKFRFDEDGDEFHFDMMLSGDDKPYSEFTKRDAIPGISLDILVSFASTTSAEIVNAFNVWLCKVAYSLESAGVDSEIVFHYRLRGTYRQTKDNGLQNTYIRVKKENEVVDFTSFSPMLSPASYRTFALMAYILHGESRKWDITMGMGRGDNSIPWGVNYNAENSKLEITVERMATSFPEEEMNEMLRAALRELMGKA